MKRVGEVKKKFAWYKKSKDKIGSTRFIKDTIEDFNKTEDIEEKHKVIGQLGPQITF